MYWNSFLLIKDPWSVRLGLHLLADLGQGMQDRKGQFLDDMERADLVRHAVEDQRQRLGIQGRAVGGDAARRQAPAIQWFPESLEKAADIRGLWRMVQHPVGQTPVGAVIDDAQHAERAIVQFINRDVPGEPGQ